MARNDKGVELPGTVSPLSLRATSVAWQSREMVVMIKNCRDRCPDSAPFLPDDRKLLCRHGKLVGCGVARIHNLFRFGKDHFFDAQCQGLGIHAFGRDVEIIRASL